MADSPVLLITGASTGIGAKTAHHAVDAGYRVVLGARSQDKLESLASELGGADKALAVPTDVTEWGECENLVAKTTEQFGGFDAVFANAGFGASRGFLEESPEHWRSMVLTNVLGVAYTIRATLPHLLEKGTGHFVITSSVAGRRALPGSLYSATKWSVTAMGEALRRELRQMRQQAGRRARGRGHRPSGDVRVVATRACRRERDADPPDGAADVGQTSHAKPNAGGRGTFAPRPPGNVPRKAVCGGSRDVCAEAYGQTSRAEPYAGGRGTFGRVARLTAQ
jgi:NADP-dependent 3-hydroxy acid dehydrogenase YdfG